MLKLGKKQLLTLLDTLPIGVIVLDQRGIVRYLNHPTAELFDYSAEELIGSTIEKLVPTAYRHDHHAKVNSYINNPTQRAMSSGRVLPVLTKAGREIHLEIGLAPLVLEGDHYVLASLLDASNQVLKVSSYNDQLTGLPNRVLFTELSEKLRHLAIRNHTSLTLLFIDLDGFKAINDNCGHQAGDDTLCQVATILQDSIRKNDVAARIGGDEFLVCAYAISTSANAMNMATTLVKKIQQINLIDNQSVELGASIGAIITRDPAKTDIQEMIRLADERMYQAKHSGKGKCILSEL